MSIDEEEGLTLPPNPFDTMDAKSAAGLLSHQFALISDRGCVRELNEDSAFAFSQAFISSEGIHGLGVFMVADGMGGHASGERASRLAVQAASESLLREVALPLADPTREAWRSVPINEAMERAFQEAQRRVLEEVAGGATTLTIVLLLHRRAYVGHVGDCRLYLLHKDLFIRLTRDHSVLSRLLEMSQFSEEEIALLSRDPRRNALYRAVGQPGHLEIDLSSHVVEPEDGLLLCSDGLWGSVPDVVMRDIILQAESPAAACRRLVDEANARGGPDNITAIVVYPIG